MQSLANCINVKVLIIPETIWLDMHCLHEIPKAVNAASYYLQRFKLQKFPKQSQQPHTARFKFQKFPKLPQQPHPVRFKLQKYPKQSQQPYPVQPAVSCNFLARLPGMPNIHRYTIEHLVISIILHSNILLPFEFNKL